MLAPLIRSVELSRGVGSGSARLMASVTVAVTTRCAWRRRRAGTIATRHCFGSMKTFKELLAYIAVISVIVLGLAACGIWVISPEPTMKAEAKAPIVPQKFLDSIERKKPVADDVVAVRAAVPVMQVSPASLPQPVLHRQTIREVSRPAPKPKRRQSVSGPPPIEVSVAPAGRAASAPVSTARTDFPY